MQRYSDSKPYRTFSEGNILLLEQNDFRNSSLNASQTYKEVSRSCQSMSTSVNEFDCKDNESDSRTIHIRKPSLRGVKKLMSRIVGSNTVKRSKQANKEGLVKGGLTPTLRRRENWSEGGTRDDENQDKKSDSNDKTGGYTDSQSRPLMTKPNSQIANLPKWDKTPGTLGIYNHGNTCFMNTVLQCISNTDQCAEYFVLKHFKEILHVKGIAKRLVGSLKGDITEHLSQLLESLWSLNYSPALSEQFKSVISKYNSQYKGSSQHDAQEFLLWLLDRLNEELHHSQKKKSKDTLSRSKKVLMDHTLTNVSNSFNQKIINIVIKSQKSTCVKIFLIWMHNLNT